MRSRTGAPGTVRSSTRVFGTSAGQQALSGQPGTYRLQAEIARCHATAPDTGSTDWAAIVNHYDALLIVQPSPVIALNRDVAVGFCDGAVAGLMELDSLSGAPELASYHLQPATRADFLRRLGRNAVAADAYRQAYDLAPTEADRRFLHRRLQECEH